MHQRFIENGVDDNPYKHIKKMHYSSITDTEEIFKRVESPTQINFGVLADNTNQDMYETGIIREEDR